MDHQQTDADDRAPRDPGPRTPFQQELIRLIAGRSAAGGEAWSGRGLSAKLGKSNNHLWQMLNRGMIPSGQALLELAAVLDLTADETDRLVLAAVETKALTRSRDTFWIGHVRRLLAARDAEIAELRNFIRSKGLDAADVTGRRHKR